MAEIVPIPSYRAADIWPACLPLLQPSIEKADGVYEADDILALIVSRDMQLWVIRSEAEILAAAVSEIVTYPRKKVVRVVLVGGQDLQEWWILLDQQMGEFGASHGCSDIEVIGRKGWARPEGGRLVGHVIRKAI